MAIIIIEEEELAISTVFIQ